MKKSWLGATLAAIALLADWPAAAQVGIVSVTGGRAEGITADGVTSFKGIPFAAPPVENLRWRAPQPVRPWSGIKKADHFAPGCMQPADLMRFNAEPPAISEDCLYLNVWTPAKSVHERLPVMVWIYGGGGVGGMTSQAVYDGTHLAQKGIVLVSVSYRLGVFGFLADPELSAESPQQVSGNYALLDMIAGLRWVKRNIEEFGGDPARVTIFGESAGGGAVSVLVQSPLARGLFQRAIAESGAPLGFDDGGYTTLRQAQQTGQRFLAKLGATTIAAARGLDAQVLLKAQGPALSQGARGFQPLVVKTDAFPGDGYRLYQTDRFNDTPVLVGSNSDEGSTFVPAHTSPSQFEAQVRARFGPAAAGILAAYPHATDSESSQAAAELFRDVTFAWRDWIWAKLQSQKDKRKAYVYYFDEHAPQYPPQGSPHGAELGYVFDNLGTLVHSDAPPTFPAPATDPALAAMISGYWVNFARTGDPNGPGLPMWPAFTTTAQKAMVFDAHPSARALPNRRQLEALDVYFAWRREQEKKQVN